MTKTDQAVPPDAVLLLSPQCPYCPQVLNALGELVKEGSVGRLEVINIAAAPAAAERYAVRSVPWCRIGPFEFSGVHTLAELRAWAERSGNVDGMAAYFSDRLDGGQAEQVRRMLAEEPARMDAVLALLADVDTPMQVRLGLDMILEELKPMGLLERILAGLTELSRHGDARIRGDACHYLAMSGNPEVIPALEARSADDDLHVREIAQEGLAALTVNKA